MPDEKIPITPERILEDPPAIVEPVDVNFVHDDSLPSDDCPRAGLADVLKYLNLAEATPEEVASVDEYLVYEGSNDLKGYVERTRRELKDDKFEPSPSEVRDYLGLPELQTKKSVMDYVRGFFKNNW